MRVINEAGIPADRLQDIRSFLMSKFPNHIDVVLHLTMETDREAPGAAFMTADSIPSGGWKWHFPQRHMVKVYVPTLCRPYPTVQQNPAVSRTSGSRCPRITLRNWEEELVIVLAHEFTHIDQYVEHAADMVGIQNVVLDSDHNFEVMAECRAEGMLFAWRNRLVQRGIKARRDAQTA